MSHKTTFTAESYPHYNNKKDKEKTVNNEMQFS